MGLPLPEVSQSGIGGGWPQIRAGLRSLNRDADAYSTLKAE